jgi:hypothetical protein
MALDPNDPLVAAYSSARRVRPADPLAPGGPGSSVDTTGKYGTNPINVNPDQIGRFVRRIPAEPTAPAAPGAPAGGDPNDPFGAPGITDPSFKVVQRGFQYQNDTLGQNAAGERADINDELNFYLPEVWYQGEQARRNIGFDAESRGISRSGEYARNVAEQMRAEQQQVAQATMSAQQRSNTVERGLATQQADLRRRYAEQLQTAAQRQYLQTGVQPYQ